MSDRSDLRAVVAALATLPEIDRAALLMRAGEALPYEEIAAALGITDVGRQGQGTSVTPEARRTPQEDPGRGRQGAHMRITQDIVKDLLTVYLAGEASADTTALIETWLRTDPALARQVHQARHAGLPPVPAPSPTVEKRALDRTRRQLHWRAILLGSAIYVSTLPLSVTFNRAGFRGLLIEDWPQRIVVIALAAALWVAYWRISRRLRV